MKDFKIPFSEEAERAVLGSIFIDPHVINLVEGIVESDDFYHVRNKNIYQAMLELHERNKGIDLITVCDILEDKNQLDKLWGISNVSELSSEVPSSSNTIEYAKIIKEKSRQRSAKKIAEDVLHGDYTPENISKIFENFIKSDSSSDTLSIKDALGQALDQMFAVGDEKNSISTGFEKLNNILNGGLRPGDVYVMAGRPSMGKTTLSIQIGFNIAKKYPVGVFSLETEAYMLTMKFLSSLSGIPEKLIKEPEQISEVVPEIESRKMYFYDNMATNITDIKSKMRAMHYDKKIKVFIVDYLQLISGSNPRESKNNQVGEVSSELKKLARELKVPIILISQLSRAVEKREPPVPKLSDLRDSGNIEQDADVVMMLYRAGYYDKNFEDDNLTNLYIRKNRNGEVTTNEAGIRFDFNMDIQKFNELP